MQWIAEDYQFRYILEVSIKIDLFQIDLMTFYIKFENFSR